MVFGKKTGNSSSFDGSIFSRKNIFSIADKIFKSGNKYTFGVILIIGILLMTIPESISKSSSDLKLDSEEEKLEHILEQIEGCGDVAVMITYNATTRYAGETVSAKGAVVVADGADSPEINNRISEAVQATLDLPAHKVRVYKSKHGKG